MNDLPQYNSLRPSVPFRGSALTRWAESLLAGVTATQQTPQEAFAVDDKTASDSFFRTTGATNIAGTMRRNAFQVGTLFIKSGIFRMCVQQYLT